MYNTYATSSKLHTAPPNKKDKKLYKHPTIKPLDLIEKLVKNSSKENDIVLDPFLGSGTTAVACKNNNRQCIGVEINEEYYKIACDRLNGITADGQTSIFTDFNKN